jgi:hypothetical protein
MRRAITIVSAQAEKESETLLHQFAANGTEHSKHTRAQQ